MKGISPMIATVLLIAFTIAVGGILSVWLTGYTRTTTATVETQGENQTKCAGSYIKIDSATASRIIYSNPSTQTVSNITFITSDGTSVNTTNTSLTSGNVAQTNWTKGTNTSILAKGLCLASIPVEGSCKSTDQCWG